MVNILPRFVWVGVGWFVCVFLLDLLCFGILFAEIPAFGGVVRGLVWLCATVPQSRKNLARLCVEDNEISLTVVIVGVPMVVVLNIDNPQRYATNKVFRRHVTI